MRNQIKTGAVLSYLQIALSVIIGLVYTPIMIRLLGKSEYGLYNTVASLTAMLSVLSLGFNSCYMRYYSKYKAEEDNERKIAGLNGLFLTIFLVIGGIALLCGLFLCGNLSLVFDQGLTPQEYDTAKTLMLLLTLNLAVSFPMSVFANIVSAHERFIFLKSLNILKTVLSPFLAIPLLLLGVRSVGLVVATLTVSIITDVLYFCYVKFKLKQRFRFRGYELGIVRALFGYTFFIALHIVVDQINWNVDKILLGRYHGTGETAVYSVGFSLYSYYMTIGSPLIGIFTPRVHFLVEETRGKLEERRRGLTEMLTKVARVQWLILGLVMTGLIFFGRPFIAFWAGEGYEAAYYVALLLVVPGTIDLIQKLGIEMQRAQNKHKFRAIVYIAMACINVVISIYLCQRYGAVGSAIGTAISLLLVQGLIINIYLHKRCCIDIIAFWRSIGRMSLGMILPCLVGVAMFLLVDFASIWLLLGGIAAYTAVYFLSMYLCGMNTDEKGAVNSVLAKLKLIKK